MTRLLLFSIEYERRRNMEREFVQAIQSVSVPHDFFKSDDRTEERVAAQNIHIALHYAIDNLANNDCYKVVGVHQIDEIEIIAADDPLEMKE